MNISLRFIMPGALLWCAAVSLAQPIRLVQEPALSPDGATVAFAWHGDIWSVPVAGGTARRLTQHTAQESAPAFSPDGKDIAFISDREHSKQLYVMPVAGGPARQLTFHTEGFDLEEWMPDGKSMLVSVIRDLSWTSRPARLAIVSAEKRQAEELLLDDYASDGSVAPDGQRVLFCREGEAWWRQGYHGSRAGQIWMLDRRDGSCRKILGEETECRWPRWQPDGHSFYYVSNRAGAYNLWEHDLASGAETQRTNFATDSVLFPAISRDGRTLVFRHGVELFRWHPADGQAPVKIEIEGSGESDEPPVTRTVLDKATDVAFTADGLQMAFIAGGDVWVMDTELKEPRQVTHTPEEERGVVFAPDGKSLWFISDAEGQTDIWKAEPENPASYWWGNSSFRLTQVTKDAEQEARIQFTRDGSHMAYTKGRGDLWLADGDGQNARLLFKGWEQPRYDFSPDGSWLVYSVSDEWFNRDIWLLPLDGSRPTFNLSRHPNDDIDPVWSPDGKLIAWIGKRENDEEDLFYVWLRAEDEERSRRERTLNRARERMIRGAATPSPVSSSGTGTLKKSSSSSSSTGTRRRSSVPSTVWIDFDEIHERIHRITVPHTAKSGLLWSPDSHKLAFHATVEGKHGLYTVEIPENLKPVLLSAEAPIDARWLATEQGIVGLREGVPTSVSAKGTVSSYKFRAPQLVDRAGKQRAVFDQCWRTMRDRFYDERLGNRDWEAVRAKYADAAAEAPDMKAVLECVQLMLGELNGSHLGFKLNDDSAPGNTWRDETAHLGLRFDPAFAGPGWKVRDVLPKSPAARQATRIEPGEVILRVDGTPVLPKMDVSLVLNGPLERDMTLHVLAANGSERDVTLRPISFLAARKLLYGKWIEENRQAVDRASHGTLGYLHISKMDDESFQHFQEELYNAGAGKEGLIIDVRENGGGNTADHLLTALSQPAHAITVPRGGGPGYPQDRVVFASWSKPIVVICNQNSFSNTEIFCHAIKTLQRGALVGVATAGGVISTGTFKVMDVGTLRLPYRGWFDITTGADYELNGAQPDYVIWPEPGDLARGIDPQLTKSIEVLRDEVAAAKLRAQPTLLKASERKPAEGGGAK